MWGLGGARAPLWMMSPALHPPGADQGIGDAAHLPVDTLDHQDLQTVGFVDVHVEGGDDVQVMAVLQIHQAVGQVAVMQQDIPD